MSSSLTDPSDASADDALVQSHGKGMNDAHYWLRMRVELLGYVVLTLLVFSFLGFWLKLEGWIGLMVGVGPFITSVGVALILLMILQHMQNVTLENQWSLAPVWGMPIAFAVGILAKLVVVLLNIVYYVMLYIIGMDLDSQELNPTAVALIASIIFIGLAEEITKYLFLASFDNLKSDAFGRRLNLYHPMGLVMLGVAISLGSTGWSVISATYEPDHGLSWYYAYSLAVLEPILNAATGAIVASVYASGVLQGEIPSHSSAIFPAIVMRSTYFFLIMLPYRETAYKAEEPLCHLMRRIARVVSDHDTAVDAQVVGHKVAVIYVLAAMVVMCAVIFARARVSRLREVFGEERQPTQENIRHMLEHGDDL